MRRNQAWTIVDKHRNEKETHKLFGLKKNTNKSVSNRKKNVTEFIMKRNIILVLLLIETYDYKKEKNS